MPVTGISDSKVDVGTGAEKAESCTGCHNSMVSLRGRGAATITEQMRAIRAGRASHPPGLAELLEEDLEIIAAFLDGAD